VPQTGSIRYSTAAARSDVGYAAASRSRARIPSAAYNTEKIPPLSEETSAQTSTLIGAKTGIKSYAAMHGPMSQLGQKRKYSPRVYVFRFAPDSGH
jgi:hypothetical protein